MLYKIITVFYSGLANDLELVYCTHARTHTHIQRNNYILYIVYGLYGNYSYKQNTQTHPHTQTEQMQTTIT